MADRNMESVGGEYDDRHLINYDTDYGIGGNYWIRSTIMINVARYEAIAPRDVTANVCNLPFNI